MLILGAGLAGMTAALELREAGYKVQVLEFNSRPGGRNWTLRGGDSFTELGGATQTCDFEDGPLPQSRARGGFPITTAPLLDYCKRLGVALEPFIQLNHNALLHATKAFGGKPQRIREIKTDFQGHVSELLAKVTQQGKLDEAVSAEDQEILLQALRSWGALDKNYAYKANLISADFRGYAKDPGGGLGAAPVAGEPIELSDILKSRLWRYLRNFALHEFQTTMFQPVGGMDMIGKAFAREVGDLIQLRCQGHPDPAGRRRRHRHLCEFQNAGDAADRNGRLVRLHHSAVDPEPDRDRRRPAHEGGDRRGALCVLGQDRPAVQAPLLGRGRGDLRRHQLHRSADPADLLSEQRLQPQRPRRAARRLSLRGRQRLRIHRDGAGGAGRARGRIRRPHSSAIQRRVRERHRGGLAPRALHARLRRRLDRRRRGQQHYDNLCQIDGRIVLAGEHASYIPAWQEGAILSSLDAITRLHERVVRK